MTYRQRCLGHFEFATEALRQQALDAIEAAWSDSFVFKEDCVVADRRIVFDVTRMAPASVAESTEDLMRGIAKRAMSGHVWLHFDGAAWIGIASAYNRAGVPPCKLFTEANADAGVFNDLDAALAGHPLAVRVLDLSGLELGELPGELRRCTNIETLKLESNRLKKLPDWLVAFEKLHTLDLRHNRLNTVPRWIGELGALRSLNIERNRIKKLPRWITGVKGLRELVTDCDELPEKVIGELTCLERIVVESRVPDCLFSLPRLRHVRGIHWELSEQVRDAKQLETLHARVIERPPEGIFELRNLRTLELEGKGARPSEIDLSYDEATGKWNPTPVPDPIPLDGLAALTQLVTLKLSCMRIDRLTEAIGSLSQLRHLALDDCDLTSVPESLGELRQLISLNLGKNRLTELPESLGGLEQLQALHLAANRLASFPDWIGRLPQLRSLLVHKNPLNVDADLRAKVENDLRFVAFDVPELPVSYDFVSRWPSVADPKHF